MLGAENNYIKKSINMRNSILIFFLFCATLNKILAQDIALCKNKFGVTLSTNIFGINDDLENIEVSSGFYFRRKISNRISIYTEINYSNRNYGDLSLISGAKGKFTTGNLAIYISPMFDIGNTMNLSLGIVENYLFDPELKTTTGTKDIRDETTNYSSLFFDFRKSIYKEVSLGIRYELGLNSMFHSIDRKVTNISFNIFLQLRGKSKQEKND